MHWCLGVYGSGSTWIFNAVRKIALVLLPERPLVGRFIVRQQELPALDDATRQVIIKSHETDEAAAAELSKYAQAIWLTIRDPRDCVTSLVQHHGLDFSTALQKVDESARFCNRFAAHPRTTLLRYEAGFFDDPATLDRLAAGFGGALAPCDRARIYAETRRAAVEALIAQLETLPTAVRPKPNALVDTVTQWHDHHAARTGESGRWRRILTLQQAADVERLLADWMSAYGYRPETSFS